MAGPCNPTFQQLAHDLGNFGCSSAQPFVQFRNPWHLTNWTLPVIEAVMVGGALLALVHAIRHWRRQGDPTVLALWGASIVYLLVLEPPLYFPETFGLQHQVGLVFVHNVFTVQFLYDRLPLYIVALYPAMLVLSYEIVRSVGVFRRSGTLAGAICVGFVHHCLYEVFDQLGPQLRWWVWNPQAKASHPAVAAVPMTSMVLFATVAPFALTLLVRWLVGQKIDRGDQVVGWSLTGRIVLAGLLVPLLVLIGSVPVQVFGGTHPNITAEAVLMSLELVAIAITAGFFMGKGWRRSRNGEPSATASTRLYIGVHGGLYLAAMMLLWITALPAYLGARDGVTATGTRTGSLPYAAAAFGLSVTWVVLAISARGDGGALLHGAVPDTVLSNT
jgi:hypothetical protein